MSLRLFTFWAVFWNLQIHEKLFQLCFERASSPVGPRSQWTWKHLFQYFFSPWRALSEAHRSLSAVNLSIVRLPSLGCSLMIRTCITTSRNRYPTYFLLAEVKLLTSSWLKMSPNDARMPMLSEYSPSYADLGSPTRQNVGHTFTFDTRHGWHLPLFVQWGPHLH